jgi:hypothetical protein
MRPKRTPGLAALASFNHQKIMYTVKQEKKRKGHGIISWC